MVLENWFNFEPVNHCESLGSKLDWVHQCPVEIALVRLVTVVVELAFKDGDRVANTTKTNGRCTSRRPIPDNANIKLLARLSHQVYVWNVIDLGASLKLSQ